MITWGLVRMHACFRFLVLRYQERLLTRHVLDSSFPVQPNWLGRSTSQEKRPFGWFWLALRILSNKRPQTRSVAIFGPACKNLILWLDGNRCSFRWGCISSIIIVMMRRQQQSGSRIDTPTTKDCPTPPLTRLFNLFCKERKKERKGTIW